MESVSGCGLWTILVLYSRAVFIFNEPTFTVYGVESKNTGSGCVGGEGVYSVAGHSCCLYVTTQQATGGALER
jgi:hypothetical protein